MAEVPQCYVCGVETSCLPCGRGLSAYSAGHGVRTTENLIAEMHNNQVVMHFCLYVGDRNLGVSWTVSMGSKDLLVIF